MDRNLINADEIMKLPLSNFILLCQGLPPYIGKKNVYYEDPIFTSRLLPPAFTAREEAVKLAASSIRKIEKRLKASSIKRAPETRGIEMDDDEILRMYDKLDYLLDEDETGKRQETSVTSESRGNFL